MIIGNGWDPYASSRRAHAVNKKLAEHYEAEARAAREPEADIVDVEFEEVAPVPALPAPEDSQ